MTKTKYKTTFLSFIRNFRRELLISFSKSPKPQKWIFIAGCYNSGTTLLSKILGSHPDISALPAEGQYLTDQLPRDHELGLSRMWVEREDIYRLSAEQNGPDVKRLKHEWSIRFDHNKPIFLEHTPANCARMPWLQKNFENSYFIAIVRNGFAVSEGIVRKAKPIHRLNGWTLEMAANQWLRSNEIILEDSKFLKNFYLLKYEDFTENPLNELLKIYTYLDIRIPKNLKLSQSWKIHEIDEPIANLNYRNLSKLSKNDFEKIKDVAYNMLAYYNYL